MKTKGVYKGLSRDLDGGLIVSFRAFEEKKVIGRLEDIKTGTVEITVEPVKKKRSLSANAYYFCLVGKMAAKLGVSTSRVHNMLLRRYGALETVDGESLICFLPDTEKAEETALEADTYHVKPTSATKVFKDGSVRRMYMILKGSHTYDTKEMSKLIDYLIADAEELGIQTMQQEELNSLIKEWGKGEIQKQTVADV